ncbi:hypothetical protein ES703_73318 [subsurface metagenome]
MERKASRSYRAYNLEAEMKVIFFKKKGRMYELMDETTFNHGEGVQVIGGGVRVEITKKSGKLTIQLPDVTTRFKVDPKKREFILFKKAKEKEEA